MSSIQEASKKAVNLGKQLKAIIEVGECLEELGSLELARKEAEQTSIKAKEQCAKEVQKLDDLQEQTIEAQDILQHEQVITRQLYDDTQFKVNALLDQAKVDGDVLKRKAVKEAAQTVLNMESEVDVLLIRRDKYQSEVNLLQKQLQTVRAELTVLREKLG